MIPNHVKTEFDRLRYQIQRAIDRGVPTHSVDDIWQEICAGRMQFWSHGDSIIITQIICHPRSKMLWCGWAAGELSEVLGQLRDKAESFGWAHGCTHFGMFGRPGWKKVLTDYSVPSVVLFKEV